MGRASLIFVLGFIVIFGMVRINIDKTSENASENSSEFTETILVRNIAASALEYGLSLYTNTGADTAYSNSDYLGGSFTATFTSLGDTTRLIVISTFEGESYTSRVDIIATYEYFPDATGGSQMGSGPGGLQFNIDPGVTISGMDTNIDGTSGPGPNIAAVTVNNTADSIIISANTSNLTGDPLIEVVPPDTTAPTVDELVAHYATIADFSLTGGNYSDVTWGSLANPVVVYSNSATRLEGTTAGYGILAIDGSLKMENSTAWYGLVLVNNTDGLAAFSAEGTPEIYGSIMMTSDTTTTATMEGTVSIYYSSEAMGTASTAFSDATAANGGGGGGTTMTISEKIYYE